MSTTGALREEAFDVAMADVDAAGILYYASPLRWAERMVSAWMREIGYSTSDLLAAGHGAPAVHVEVDYRRPIGLDQPIRAELHASTHSRSSFTLVSRFRRAGEESVAVEVRTKMVWVSHEPNGGGAPILRSSELPDAFRRSLERHLPGATARFGPG